VEHPGFAAVEKLAAEHNVSLNVVVLAYLISEHLQTIPIIGASAPAQIEESVAAAKLKLSAEELVVLSVSA
jgi:aryl-alcohol dehydrogenase-like predicted oxidoreductase